MSEELAWAAGFFDGEGSFTGFAKKQGFYPQAGIGQNDRFILVKFQTIVGLGNINGPYRYGKNKNFHWQYTASGSACHELADVLWPWLGSTKRAQADRIFAKEKIT